MSAPVEEPLRRVRMSWEEFLALPDQARAEWVDGEAVLQMTPPIWDHSRVVHRLSVLLDPLFPGFEMGPEPFTAITPGKVRLPDFVMVAQRPTDGWVRQPPVLIVEVLSPSTWLEDTVRKSAEYLDGGAGQYWVIDPTGRTLDAWRHGGEAWELALHLDAGSPVGEVELAGVTVPLDLDVIVRP